MRPLIAAFKHEYICCKPLYALQERCVKDFLNAESSIWHSVKLLHVYLIMKPTNPFGLKSKLSHFFEFQYLSS